FFFSPVLALSGFTKLQESKLNHAEGHDQWTIQDKYVSSQNACLPIQYSTCGHEFPYTVQMAVLCLCVFMCVCVSVCCVCVCGLCVFVCVLVCWVMCSICALSSGLAGTIPFRRTCLFALCFSVGARAQDLLLPGPEDRRAQEVEQVGDCCGDGFTGTSFLNIRLILSPIA